MIFKRNKEVRIPLGKAEWSIGLGDDEVDGYVEIHGHGDDYCFEAHTGADSAYLIANREQLLNLAETIKTLMGPTKGPR